MAYCQLPAFAPTGPAPEDLGPSQHVKRHIQALILPGPPHMGKGQGRPLFPLTYRARASHPGPWLSALMHGCLEAPPSSLEPQLFLPLSL